MIESIGLNLIASGLASAGGTGKEQVRETLRGKRFSEAIDGLTTEFITALNESVEPARTERVAEVIGDIEANWSTIAKELDNHPSKFESEQEAIARIIDAIMTGMGVGLHTNPTIRDAVDAAVTEAYQMTLRTFAERIAGTELAEVFTMETTIELTTAVDALDEQLTVIQREMRRQETAALRNAGFVRLDSLYFERHEPEDPETAWRTGFDLADVEAGFPLSRERPATTDDERHVIADEVFERLVADENVVVLGEGGTGKSTLCKQVACQWHADADRGLVLYRDRVTTTSFDASGMLIEAIHAAKDELLIVVEDASNGVASAIFEVLDEVDQTRNVAVLLTSNDWKWHTNTDVIGHTNLKRQRQQFGIVEIPTLDERECQRVLDHYQALTGVEIEWTSEQVYEEVRDVDIGGFLVLVYRLTGPATNIVQSVSAVHADVYRIYTAIEELAGEDAFPQTVAAMVNILNAARLPVETAYVHALADDRDEHRAIDRTLEVLDDLMFEQTGEERRMPHPLWSALYLERILEVAGEPLARDHFEQCVDSLFRLIDEEARREKIRHWLHSDPEVFGPLTETPEAVARQFVRRIADSGAMRPALGAIYGTPETWSIRLPDSCPVATHLQWHITRCHIHLYREAFGAAQAELDRLNALIESQTEEIEESERSQVTMLDSLLTIAWMCGDLAAASEFYENSLPIPREMDDRNGDTQDPVDLGVLTCKRWDPEIAHEYHKEALIREQERDNQRGIARCLTNLGVIAYKRARSYNSSGTRVYKRDDLEAARKYYERALTIKRERGNQYEIARCLTNLGKVAHKRGDQAVAYEYHERALTIERERGNPHGIARCLTNLGKVDRTRRDLELAEKHLKDALTIRREMGDRYGIRQSLSTLRDLAHERDDQAAASKYHKKVHALWREIGNGEKIILTSLSDLGRIANERGDQVATTEYYEKMLAIYRGVGNRQGETSTLAILGRNVEEHGDRVAATEYYEQELEIYQEIDRDSINVRKAHTLVTLGRIARERGNQVAAENCFEEAISIFVEDSELSHELDTLANRIDVCEQRGDAWEAIKWCEQAIALAERADHETERKHFKERRSALVNTEGE